MSDNVIFTNSTNASPKEMVLLFGAGYMAKEYAKVLKAQNVPLLWLAVEKKRPVFLSRR